MIATLTEVESAEQTVRDLHKAELGELAIPVVCFDREGCQYCLQIYRANALPAAYLPLSTRMEVVFREKKEGGKRFLLDRLAFPKDLRGIGDKLIKGLGSEWTYSIQNSSFTWILSYRNQNYCAFYV